MKLTSLLLLGALSACGADSIDVQRAELQGLDADYTLDPTVTRLARIGGLFRHNVREAKLIPNDRVLLTGAWGSRIVTLDGDDLGSLEGDVANPSRIRALVGSLANGNIVVVWIDNGPPTRPSVVQVHDPDGNLVATLPGPFLYDYLGASVTLDGRQILLSENASSLGDAYVRVLDAETLAETRFLTVHHRIDGLDMLTTGEIVVLDHDDDSNARVVIYDAADNITATVPGVTKLGELRALPNGDFLTVSGPLPFATPDTVRVFDRTGALVWSDSHAPATLAQIEVDDSTILVSHVTSSGTEARLFDLAGTLLANYSGLPAAGDLMRLPNRQLLSIYSAFVADVRSTTPITWPVDRLSGALLVPQTGSLIAWRNFDVRSVYRLDF